MNQLEFYKILRRKIKSDKHGGKRNISLVISITTSIQQYKLGKPSRHQYFYLLQAVVPNLPNLPNLPGRGPFFIAFF